MDFLISAPYADKLPKKVAELIRKDIPFAILIPLTLLNEVDRTGKDSIDEEVRAKRLNMKLVVSTSLGQGWLINHPECKLDKTSHAIFFTTCTNQVLQDKSEDIFLDWTQDASQHSQSKFTPSEQNTRDIDSAILHSIDEMFSQDAKHALTPRELRAKKRTRLTENVYNRQSNTEGQNSTATVSINNNSKVRKDKTISLSQCIRTATHPLHVISTSRPPDPIETWPDKQLKEDITKGTIRVPKENLKHGLPTNLIVVKDEKGRERILVPRCQRVRLVTTEHETMLHVEGARAHYELARKYIWPNMVREIKIICKACQTCGKAKFANKICPPNLSKLTRTIFLCQDRPTVLTFMVTPKAKS